MVERFATHDHRADRAPFLNLGDLGDDEVEAVLSALAAGSRPREVQVPLDELPLEATSFTWTDTLASPTEASDDGYQHRFLDHDVELQLWVDGTVASYLTR